MGAKVNNHFSLSNKAMNMTRFMVLRVRDEQDISETERCHASKYNPSALGYQTGIMPHPCMGPPSPMKPGFEDLKRNELRVSTVAMPILLLNSHRWNFVSRFLKPI